MLVFLIDDEEYALKDIKSVMAEAEPDAEIMAFTRCEEALEVIRLGMKPDAVLSDITMPGISGLEFATSVKTFSEDTHIIFTTAHSEYAVDAFRIKANGYLLKPIIAEDLKRELSYVPGREKKQHDRLDVHCFGYFDVYWHDEPLVFGRKQSKELLAYLIDREGAACSSGEIGLALWEDDADEKAEKNRIRVLINDLKNTLKNIGIEDALIRDKREIAIKKDYLDCDYYRLLDGDMDALNSYHGEYMKQYGWAELTNARLHFIKNDNEKTKNGRGLWS